jgi:hypothetical protein
MSSRKGPIQPRPFWIRKRISFPRKYKVIYYDKNLTIGTLNGLMT